MKGNRVYLIAGISAIIAGIINLYVAFATKSPKESLIQMGLVPAVILLILGAVYITISSKLKKVNKLMRYSAISQIIAAGILAFGVVVSLYKYYAQPGDLGSLIMFAVFWFTSSAISSLGIILLILGLIKKFLL